MKLYYQPVIYIRDMAQKKNMAGSKYLSVQKTGGLSRDSFKREVTALEPEWCEPGHLYGEIKSVMTYLVDLLTYDNNHVFYVPEQ